MSGHTQGPWEVFPSEYDGSLYVMPEGMWEGRGGAQTICVVLSQCRKDNARLIASAPEMLEACIAASRGEHRAHKLIRAAIAKATGASE